MPFTVTTHGPNRLGLAKACQRYVDDLWLADHMTAEQAAASALDHFMRAVLAEIEMLEVRWNVPPSPTADGF